VPTLSNGETAPAIDLREIELTGKCDLSERELTTLPPEIIPLTNLRELDLRDNQLTELPPEIGQLTNLRKLNLGENQLTELPPEIGQLTNLRELRIGENQLTELPPEIAQLTNLRKLNLGENQLTELPPEIILLANLRELNLDGNQLTELRPEIAQLTKLRELNVGGNQLTTLPPEITQLTKLRELNLDGNQLTTLPPEVILLTNLKTLGLGGLTTLPPEIGQLTNLRELNLGSNLLTTLPPEIAQLTNLRDLGLLRSELTALPLEVTQLTNLRELNLNYNQLTTLPPEIGQLANLRELRIGENQLTTLPPEIGQLANLQTLWLDRNQLTTLPPEIGQLTNLRLLGLPGNQLTTLPSEIADQLDAGLELVLSENPLAEPLPELVQQGSSAVAVYLRSLRDGIAQYEAKVLLVGEGNVGKTSLSAALRGDIFVKDRPFTHGIQIQPLILAHTDAVKEMTVRIWDFGGQEVYRVTHQFFFSHRAVYVVVWKPREGQEQNEVEGWLRRVRLRVGPTAEVLIVATHCADDQRPDIDYPHLQQEFPQMLAGHFEVDNETGRGIPALREAIARMVELLPQMGQKISSRWAAVRQEISELAQAEPQISFQDFAAICQRHRVGDDEMGTLATLMHDLGQIIYYGEDEGLQDFVVLNPEWLTTAISYVLRDEQTQISGGILDHGRLRNIWQDRAGYPTRYHRYFLRLMERFDISYRLGDERRSLVAQLVPYQRPALPWDFQTPLPRRLRHLALVCQLSESAPGLMAWLTVRHHLAATGMHWRNGVFLRHPIPTYASEALLELRDFTQLVLQVRAPSPDLFFHVLSDSIEALISSRWPGLNYQLFVPCPHQNADRSSCLGRFSLNGLQRLRQRNLVMVPCMECAQEYEIELLLTGFARPAQPLTSEVQQQLNRVEDRLINMEDQAAEMAAAIRRVLRVVSIEVPDCPSLFTLAQDHPTGNRRLRVFQYHYRLTLWCQHPGYWHPWKRAAYEIDPPREWFAKISPYAVLIVRTLQLVVPLAGSIAVASQPVENIESAAAHLEVMKTIVNDLPNKPSTTKIDVDPNQATGKMTSAEGEGLRALRQVIFKYDPTRQFGGLRRVQVPSGDFLWVCPDHSNEYDPGLPIVP
jgi:Leucine-rich repeat (LRR) protein/GTPase SAR1 family protein